MKGVKLAIANERGFVLLETLLALFVLSLALLVVAELWRASAMQQRKANLDLFLSRRALSQLEQAQADMTLSRGTTVKQVTPSFENAMPPVTETTEIQTDPISGLLLITVTYAWQEGGHAFVQRFCALHPL